MLSLARTYVFNAVGSMTDLRDGRSLHRGVDHLSIVVFLDTSLIDRCFDSKLGMIVLSSK